jgi:hypothetical protein
MSGSSGYMSINSLFNFPLILTNIKSPTMLFSSVFSSQESEQHLNPLNVFSFLPSLYSHLPTVDSLTADSNRDFENLLFHFTYGSSSPSFPSNNPTETTMSQEEFKTFAKLSLYVFSSFSSFYYSLC